MLEQIQLKLVVPLKAMGFNFVVGNGQTIEATYVPCGSDGGTCW